VTALAYAKLNLSLRVLARREDGLHEIDSIVQTIDLADRIEFHLAGDRLRVESPFPPEEDLIYRAASALLAKKRAKTGIKIVLEKRIPTGAGLGGGSSDAACVITVLDRLIPPPLPPEDINSLAGALGADVPLFLRGGRLRMAGKGERITPLPSGPERAFLLILPPVHCDTAAVYRKYDEIRSTGNALALQPGENDLEEAALALYPELAPYREAIMTVRGEYWGMSGSGATFYAAFAELKRAQAAERELAALLPTARVVLCRPTTTGHEEDKSRCR